MGHICYKTDPKLLSLLSGKLRFILSQLFTALLALLVDLTGVLCNALNQTWSKMLQIPHIWFQIQD